MVRINVCVQDLRCTKLELPVLTVLVDTLVMTASVPSLNKFITIILFCGEINNQALHLPLKICVCIIRKYFELGSN